MIQNENLEYKKPKKHLKEDVEYEFRNKGLYFNRKRGLGQDYISVNNQNTGNT